MRGNVYAISYHLTDVVGRDDDDQAIFGPARGAATENVVAESFDVAMKGLIQDKTGFSDKTALIMDHFANGPQNVLMVVPVVAPAPAPPQPAPVDLPAPLESAAHKAMEELESLPPDTKPN